MTTGLPDRVALGTMHGKEVAIAPPLAALGIALQRADLDTDRFGTFAGDVPRAGDMLEAARAKARAAADATGLSTALASEGSYGPHPYMPFLPLGRELLLWLDTRSGREIVETLTDSQPNYDQETLSDPPAAVGFLTRMGFPKTAVIVQSAAGAPPLAKGITDHATLDEAIRAAVAMSGTALLQTDMRAHLNPRRMSMIGDLAQRLALRLATPCPTCTAPGFGRLRSLAGLPCRDCGSATSLIAAELYGCTACSHEEQKRREGEADPAHCPYCNP